MSFSLDKPGFLASADMSREASRDSPPPPLSAGSSSSASAPSSGDSSTCRNCPKCRRRMSKFVFDRHTVCFQCRSFDCDFDNRCDECLEWSQEEMEAYVKHKLFLLKDKRRKDSLPKSRSSPGPSPTPSQPPSLTVTDVDNRIGSQLAKLSASFDQKLESLTSVLLTKILLLQPPIEHSMSARMFDVPSTASLAVPVLCPSPRLDVEAPAQVSASASFVSAGSQVPPAVAEDPGLVHGASSAVSMSAQVPPGVAGAPAQLAAVSDRLRVRFAVPPVAGSSAPG